MNILRPVLVATAILSLSAVAAFATPATTRGPTRLYDGPSTRFQVLDELPANTDVDVIGCSREWCQIWSDEDQQGFVRERQLDFYEGPAAIVIFPPPIYQYGWTYWRQNYRGDWDRWRNRYPRHYREPPPGMRRMEPPRRPPAIQPGGPPPPPPNRNFGPPGSPPNRNFGAPGSPPNRGNGGPPRRNGDGEPAPPPGGGGGPSALHGRAPGCRRCNSCRTARGSHNNIPCGKPVSPRNLALQQCRRTP